MKLILIVLVGLFFISDAIGQVRVKGYYRKDGTYVQPHYRSSPDGNPYNNYSYPGNTNPYTGKVATGNPSTYLSNYYKTYGISATDSKYDNYTSLLNYTNYRGLSKGKSYTIKGYDGKESGRVEHDVDRIYKIFDAESVYIGYVKTNRSGRRYSVFDLYGYEVTNNKYRMDSETSASLAGAALAVVVLVIALGME